MGRRAVLGESISHYKILEKLGEGGMGEVFLAQDTSLDRKVALKFLPDLLQQDPTARKRFLREAKSAAALDHPYICKIYEVGEAEGRDFIAMEYVEGDTLKERLTKDPLPLKVALQTASEIAEALEEAHKKNIVHRDLKPSNIMLTEQGHVKVMDFGLAKRLVPVEGVGSQTQLLDQISGQQPTDIWLKRKGLTLKLGAGVVAVGIMLILIVSWSLDVLHRGEPGFSGQPSEAVEVAQDEPPRIAVLPFSNLSHRTEDEVYSDGVTESVISRLANVQALSVISRTSVMHCKGKDTPIPEIAKQLKVDYILEGSLLKLGDQCRITAQLIDVSSDTHLWAEDYRLPWSDIFTIQDEISEKVVQSANVALGIEDMQALAQAPTQNIEAYNVYLKGKYHSNRYNNFPQNREYFEEAERSLQMALQLDPSYVDPLAELGWLYFLSGYFEDGDEWLHKSEADPLYVYPYTNQAVNFLLMGRYEEALMHVREARRVEPQFWQLPALTGEMHFWKGELDKAEQAWREGLHSYPDESKPSCEISLGLIAAARGDVETVREIIQKYRDNRKGPAGRMFTVFCAFIGEKELAMDRVDNMNYRTLLVHMRFLKQLSVPAWDSLRSEPRFQEIFHDAYQKWQRDLAKYGPSLPVSPPELPTPEEFLTEE